MNRFLSLTLVPALTLVLASSAAAATVTAAQPCYANGEEVVLTGEGFAPDGPVTFTVNGRRIDGVVTTNGDGEFEANYTPPTTQSETKLVLRATDAAETTAKTTLFVTRERSVNADPSRTDNVRTWKAVFRLYGFGKGKMFIHYVGPNGKLRKTVGIGRLQGPCGRLKTDKRRVLPFSNPDFGTWKLQFDTRRRYDSDTANKRVIPVRVFRG